MIGELLSHYRILELLGEGGMGSVYRARDERLERDVALKVLRAGCVKDDPSRRRFRREALAASRLSHAGIATVHEFGTDGDIDFIVMEFVAGENLHARIARGALPESEAVAIAAQIAEALEVAHEQGVVHCDLKPANIQFTTRGQIKVLDFGLAQMRAREQAARSASSASAPASATTPPLMAGTLPYMAPEQVMGVEPDARTDVHALGVLLYEMLTGRRPYAAAHDAALIYAILHASPEPPGRLRPDLSPGLEPVILRALEKRPEHRHESARAFRDDLLRPQSEKRAEPPRRIASVAVLPLENLSGDPAEEFFADGMTEALIGDLAQIAALRVISRTSVMRYKGARRPLPEIARELGVDAVVEGTVVRAGERVRISAQLIEAAADRHVWGQSYERDFGDILALQREVAFAIAQEIRIHLSPNEARRLVSTRPVNPEAYDAYLRGRFQWNRRNPESVRRGIEFFERAIEADPSYALAWAGLADSFNVLGDQHILSPGQAAPRAKAAAHRALEIEPGLAEAHVSLAFQYAFHDWAWEKAETTFLRALELKSNYATGHQWYAEFLVMRARKDEAMAEARRAHELDPLSTVIATTHADVLYFCRRIEEAAGMLRGILEVDPSFIHGHTDLGRACSILGRHEEAIASFRTAARLREVEPDTMPGLGYAYAAAGRIEDAGRVLEQLVARRNERFVSPAGIAMILTALGENDRAFEWLDRALAERDSALVWLRVNPRLDPLREDARFAALLIKVGLAG
ncbi:MAG: protein kinase [Candidatus Eisenbacteria bacterium]